VSEALSGTQRWGGSSGRPDGPAEDLFARLKPEALSAVEVLGALVPAEVEQVAARLDESGMICEHVLKLLAAEGRLKREVEVRCGTCQGTFARYPHEDDVPWGKTSRCQSCGCEVSLLNYGRPVYSPLAGPPTLPGPRERPSALAEAAV